MQCASIGNEWNQRKRRRIKKKTKGEKEEKHEKRQRRAERTRRGKREALSNCEEDIRDKVCWKERRVARCRKERRRGEGGGTKKQRRRARAIYPLEFPGQDSMPIFYNLLLESEDIFPTPSIVQLVQRFFYLFFSSLFSRPLPLFSSLTVHHSNPLDPKAEAKHKRVLLFFRSCLLSRTSFSPIFLSRLSRCFCFWLILLA